MTWRTMESAPEGGEFLVWHEGFKEIRTARWFNGRGSPVINSASGRTFRCKWWMPKPEPPGSDTPDPRDALIETLAAALQGGIEAWSGFSPGELMRRDRLDCLGATTPEQILKAREALAAHAAWKEAGDADCPAHKPKDPT